MKVKTKKIILANRYILGVLLFISGLFSLSAQTITLSGSILNPTKKPLNYANVVAEPKADGTIIFAISDEQGRYQLSLKQNQEYSISVSYLGYNTQKFLYVATENTKKDITLTLNNEELDQITLNYTPPVVIKKDTITYNVSSFATGEERKLRDILKKLPGVEVDKKGNVLVQGKKVTKVFVENKLFFTGNSKLAVNNIPADAVDKVEVLDNHSDIAFLKGLEDSEDTAMNIKLKEDKKKFAFGDIETGVGATERYLIHPNIYYYSPKTTINIIGDINNLGEKSFTIKDYLDFEGGISRLLYDSQSYFSLFNSDFSQFLRNQNFQQSINQFGAVNISQELGDKTALSGYGIFSNAKNDTREISQNEYIGNDNFSEIRERSATDTNLFGIAKTNFSYVPNENTNIDIESYIKLSNNNSIQTTKTNSDVRDVLIDGIYSGTDFTFRENIQWHKRFNRTNTTSIVLNYQYQKSTPQLNWKTNQSLLTGLIPIVEQDVLNIFNDKSSQIQSINTIIKHYHILSANHHIYFSLGNNYSYDSYNTFEYQRLNDNSVNSFNQDGFGNQTRVNFNDFFISAEYKFKKNIFTMKTGLFYHTYSWNIGQFDNKNNNAKGVFLPEISADLDFSNSKKLAFKYKRRVRFPIASQLSNRFTLSNFNSIYQGNNTLENQWYHNASLSFYRFSLYRDIMYTISIHLRKSDRNIKNATNIQGIDYISTPLLLENEDSSWRFNGSFRKGIGKVKLSLKTDIALSNYVRPINTQLVNAKSNNYSFKAEAKTSFKNFPNIELGMHKSFSDYRSLNNAKFENTILFGNIEYDFLKNFIFSFDYQYEKYKNKTLNNVNTFDIGNTSLFYQQEDSPWGYEFSVSNIFDVRFKRRNSFSTLLISDEQTFILSRIFMAKVIYKL